MVVGIKLEACLMQTLPIVEKVLRPFKHRRERQRLVAKWSSTRCSKGHLYYFLRQWTFFKDFVNDILLTCLTKYEVFESVIVVAFQSTFCSEMHQNNVFL
jgi:hypothetical protein